MDHGYIEAHDIRARYVAGRLTAEEDEEFESHLVDCPRCIEDVACETGLREGVRLNPPEAALRAATPRTARPAWNTAPLASLLQAAAAVLLAVSIGLGVWLSRSSVELHSTRAERDESQRRAGQAEQSAAALERRLADLERRANEASAVGPIVPAAVFALTTVRGSSGSDAGPVNRITIDRNARVVVLSMDLPGPPDSDDFTVSLKDRAGRMLWTGGTFPPSSPDSLGVAVDPKLLPGGDYLLELQQRSTANGLTLVGRYPFRVVAP
jgi:hypothetical protein